jgi:Zn-dependent metalloprotease
MSNRRPTLFLTLLLGQALALPAQDEAFLASFDANLVQDLKPGLGLSPEDTVKITRIVPDPVMEGHDARLAQSFRGVPVLGGAGILHLSGTRLRSVTDAFVKDLHLDPTPLLPPDEALARVDQGLGPHGPFHVPPTATLLAARLKGEDVLVYRVHAELENGAAETSHTDWLVDARTGAVLRHWSTLRMDRGAQGEGMSQYSGKVALNTTFHVKDSTYELRDWTRGKGGNLILNLAGSTQTKDAVPFINSTNEWGDGQNYAGSDATALNKETAGVDAAYGLQTTWDYYAKVLGRKGLDGKGQAVTMRVHYGDAYQNAFWSDTCRCVTLGDGTSLNTLTSLDVIAHELSHGVCSATANLEYFGESGGLNEANSDINAVMVKFYARGGARDTIGNWGGAWTIGEDLTRRTHPRPLRWLYRPSLDGASPDIWSADLEDQDTHQASGPMNRCFFFLSQGSSPNAKSDYFTCLLMKGMEGIGNDKAARIWYRAMDHYLVSTSTYKDAREACIQSARDLYGADTSEEHAVWNAFRGIAVGPAWKP